MSAKLLRGLALIGLLMACNLAGPAVPGSTNPYPSGTPPETPADATAEAGIGIQGELRIEPEMNEVEGVLQLNEGEGITLTWVGAPNNARQVQFVLMEDDGTETILASDDDVTNGATLIWNVTPDARGTIIAYAEDVDGNVSLQSEPLEISTEQGNLATGQP